jgi:hypothetical protein
VSTGRTALITVEILAASVWIGSLASLAIVSRVADRVLEPAARVTLFRGVGRLHGMVGVACLLIAIGVGLALTWPLSGAAEVAVLVFALALIGVSAAGMAQASRMTVRRRAALDNPSDQGAADAVRRGAAFAGVLRGSIAALTLVIVVLSAHQLAT